jgi:hypothetical protein
MTDPLIVRRGYRIYKRIITDYCIDTSEYTLDIMDLSF